VGVDSYLREVWGRHFAFLVAGWLARVSSRNRTLVCRLDAVNVDGR